MKHSRLLQVKASAGSGKTFKLTQRFLALLSGAEGRAEIDPDQWAWDHAACSAAPRKGYSWPEILAATFTNKAATEMKERLVGALKGRALGQETDLMDDSWTPALAEDQLTAILRRYQRLNIRTIDSLLHMLLSIFALEAGLPPDFQLAFDEQELLDLALDRFLARCEAGDEEARQRFETAMRTLIQAQQAKGFWLAQGFRDRLGDLVRHLMDHPSHPDTDQERLLALLQASRTGLADAVRDLRLALAREKLAVNNNFIKYLEKFDGLNLFDPPPDSAFASKAHLDECLNAASRGAASAQACAAYQRLVQTAAEHRGEFSVLKGAYVLAPSVDLALELLACLEEIEREQASLPIRRLPGLVHRLLDESTGVPDAFCRLGGRLHHLLVDEFQDTGRDQWSALAPLAEECLSKGGSLFYVGDVKQAIYGWRGGDARLFDEVAGQGLAMLAGPDIERLPCNWRSLKRVVGFNNDFFTNLAQPDSAQALANALLPGGDPDQADEFVQDLEAAFADASQELPPDKDRSGGYVRFERLPGGSKAEIETQAVEAVAQLLVTDLAARRPLSDLAVLVRTGDQAEQVCARLLEESIPVVTDQSLQIARHPVIRQLTALLSWLDFPEDGLSLAEVLCGDEVFLTATGLARETVLDWLARPEQSKSLWHDFRRDFPKQWEGFLHNLLDRAGMDAPYDLLRRALARFRVLENNPGAELPVRRFLEVVHQAGEHGHGSLTAFLDFWAERGHEEKTPLPEGLDAVRILTIHKAKGLEFPVVLVPFHHWKVAPWNEFALVEHGGRQYLADLSPGLGAPYRQRLAHNALEQLNLLYVAWTRAREELYGFYPDNAPRISSAALSAMNLLLPKVLGDSLESGERPQQPMHPFAPAPAAPEKPVTEPPEEEPAGLPRLRVYSHLEQCGPDQGVRARQRGEAAHKALELLRPTGDDAADARRAVEASLRFFPLLDTMEPDQRDVLAQELEAMVAWALSLDELRPALLNGRYEPTLLAEGDKPRRPDLLHAHERGSLVVDFKTGRADPEHHGQVRRYLAILADMGAPGPLSGLLVYLDEQRLERVEVRP